jgi:hypothetical protein
LDGIRLYEVPISYYGRTFAEGKNIDWRDGFLALGALLRFRFARSSERPGSAPDRRALDQAVWTSGLDGAETAPVTSRHKPGTRARR